MLLHDIELYRIAHSGRTNWIWTYVNAFVLLSVFIATPRADAENYLLPTAIVPLGRVEGGIDFLYSRVRGNVAGPANLEGFSKISSSLLSLSLGAGIYDGVQISIQMPYTFIERSHERILNLVAKTTLDRAGTGDPLFLVDYRLVAEEARRPTVVITGGVKPDTSSDGKPDLSSGRRGGAGSGTMDYQFGVAMSKSIGAWTPYGTIESTLRGDNDEGQRRGNRWGGSIGTEYRWTDSLTIDTRVSGIRIGQDDAEDMGGRETWNARIRAYYKVWGYVFVIPSLAFIRTSDYDSDLGSGLRYENNRGYEAGVGLYAFY